MEAARGDGGSDAEDLGDANVVLVQVPLKQHSPSEGQETGLTSEDTLRRLRELNGGRMPTTGEEAGRLLGRDGDGAS